MTNSLQANVHAAREFRPEDLEITLSLEESSTSRNPITIGPIKVREPTSSPSYRAKVVLASHPPLDQNTILVSTASSTVEKALESLLDISCDFVTRADKWDHSHLKEESDAYVAETCETFLQAWDRLAEFGASYQSKEESDWLDANVAGEKQADLLFKAKEGREGGDQFPNSYLDNFEALDVYVSILEDEERRDNFPASDEIMVARLRFLEFALRTSQEIYTKAPDDGSAAVALGDDSDDLLSRIETLRGRLQGKYPRTQRTRKMFDTESAGSASSFRRGPDDQGGFWIGNPNSGGFGNPNGGGFDNPNGGGFVNPNTGPSSLFGSSQHVEFGNPHDGPPSLFGTTNATLYEYIGEDTLLYQRLGGTEGVGTIMLVLSNLRQAIENKQTPTFEQARLEKVSGLRTVEDIDICVGYMTDFPTTEATLSESEMENFLHRMETLLLRPREIRRVNDSAHVDEHEILERRLGGVMGLLL